MKKKYIDWEGFQKLYDTGKTIDDCMAIYNVGSYTTVQRAKNKGLFEPRNKRECQVSKLSPIADYEKISDLYENGKSFRELELCGFDRGQINQAKKLGLIKSRTLSQSLKLKRKNNPELFHKPTEEDRKNTSIRQSLKNSGGKSKWFEVSGKKVQGTWERDLALKFDELGIKWIKPKTHSEAWPYIHEGIEKNYTPDFYLPEYDTFLEVKGYWWGNDKEKMRLVKEQYSDRKLLIIEKKDYMLLLENNLDILYVRE